MKDGIYFGLPEDEYRALPRLSASSIKDMLVSPLTFWINSWLNPNRPEDEDTAAKALGRAYHKLILEGTEAFDAAYAVAPSRDEHPGALDGSDALKAHLKRLGLKQTGTIAEMCQRIREEDADTLLWPEIMERFKETTAGRHILKREHWVEVKRAKFVIDNMPSVSTAFQGGHSEVSLLWTDPEFGVPMKGRLDYLKLRGDIAGILDLKTFANIMDKEIRSAVANEIARNRYYVQAACYAHALNALKALYADQSAAIVHGDVDFDWIDRLLTSKRTTFHFVFVQTGEAPNVIAREFAEWETYAGNGATRNAYWYAGVSGFRNGVKLFRDSLDHYGPDVPWITDYGLKAFTDTDFPLWMIEIKEPA